jgi:hypothetical protein
MTHNKHGDHPTKRDIHPRLLLRQHFMHVKDRSQIELLLLNILNNHVKDMLSMNWVTSETCEPLNEKTNQQLTRKLRI